MSNNQYNNQRVNMVTPPRRSRGSSNDNLNDPFLEEEELPSQIMMMPQFHSMATPKRSQKNKKSAQHFTFDCRTISTTDTISQSDDSSSYYGSNSNCSPKLSPSRLLFTSMAVIHKNISHTYSSTSSEGLDEFLPDDNSLIAYDDKCGSEEGLEVILNFDQSLSYREN